MQGEDDSFEIAKTPDEIVKTEILHRRNRVINAIEKYDRYTLQGANYPSNEVRSRLLSLFHTIQASIAREKDKGKEWCREKRRTIRKGSMDEVLDIYEEIESFLDKKQLTKFDTIERHDYTRLEDDNKRAGL